MSARQRTLNNLLHCLLSVSLCVSCTTALAIPKAAEQEDDEVTFGAADAPPKPAAKPVASPAAKAVKPVKPVKPVESRVNRRGPEAKGTGRPVSQPATAGKQAAGSKPPLAAKPNSGARVSTITAPTTKKDSGKAQGKSGKK